jgi:hypothetical protein
VLSEGWAGAGYRVRTTAFDLLFITSSDTDLDELDNVDVEVRLADGSRWSATMFTVAEVQRLMSRWAETGEAQSGAFFWVSDGVIVRERGVRAMTKLIVGLYEDDELTSVLSRLDELT